MSSTATAMLAIGFILIVGLCSTFLASYLNRGRFEVYTAARLRVRERLQVRELLPPERILLDSGVTQDVGHGGRKLLSQLAKVLGVDAGRLRAADRLQDLVTVHREELPTVTDEMWRATQDNRASMGILGDDFLCVADQSPLNLGLVAAAQAEGVKARLENEDEWATWLLGHTVGELLAMARWTDEQRGP